MPTKQNNILKYKSIGAELFHPCTQSLDMETLQIKPVGLQKIKKKDIITEHKINSYSFTKDTGLNYNILKRCEGGDTTSLMEQFNEDIISLAKDYYENFLNISVRAIYDDESIDKYAKETHCHICGGEFTCETAKRKVFDHCHTTGKFRGAAHSGCNLHLTLLKFIPILIHNLKYDSKLFIEWIANLSKTEKDLRIIPGTSENYKFIALKVEVGEYIQKHNQTRCKFCNIKFKELLTTCKACKQEGPNLVHKKEGSIQKIYVEVRFIDTLAFLGTSLEKAVNNELGINSAYCAKCKKHRPLKNPKLRVVRDTIVAYDKCETCENEILTNCNYERFTLFNKIFSDMSLEDKCYLLIKGEYPYEWVDSFDKFNETKLPAQECFVSKLSGKSISSSKYKFIQRMWNHFDFKNFGQYHDLYLRLDTILLHDVFINFRKMCYDNYNLDPVYYVSAPHLANNAALKFTGQEIELYTDQSMYDLMSEGIRGGISMVSNSHAIANNCYFYDPKHDKVVKLSKKKAEEKGIYNSKKHVSFIMYLDANNLYGWAMSKKLPVKDHKWMTQEEIQFVKKNIMNIDDESDTGYSLVVDLKIPEHLHDTFNDYAPAPVHFAPNFNDLSEFQKWMIDQKLGSKPSNKTKNLMCTLNDKTHYIIDYRILKEYMSEGVELVNIHSGIKYTQLAWLKPYIEKNTKLRQQAKNDSEKEFFKLMNNSVYGKQMENVRDRTNVHITKSLNKYLKHINSKKFQHRTIINEDMILVYGKNITVKLNKPIFGGFCILELSKLLMYKYYYKYLKKQYGDKVKLLQTDTDSFIIYVECDDFYEDMKKNIHWFDSSDYPDDYPIDIPKKK